MRIDRDQFLEEGYLILRQVIPPDDLKDLRASCESLLDQQKVQWVRDRDSEDPPLGEWEKSAQPRVMVDQIAGQINVASMKAIEIWNHENVHGVSSDLLGVDNASLTEMMMMCSPIKDYGSSGHRGWLRDVYPPFSAPIQAYVDDIVENGPRYVQWNIPLYDDNVLWVIPGSHRRLNTDDENELLSHGAARPFSGGLQADLKAGDGVVYITPILHWGSYYNATMRRTLHGGFSLHTKTHDLSYAEFMNHDVYEAFQEWNERSIRTQNLTEDALRSAINGDTRKYYDALEHLHPGRLEKGRRLTSIFMSKSARRISDLRGLNAKDVPERRRSAATMVHPITLHWGADFCERFSAQEAEVLWERFRPIHEGLQASTELAPPAYEDRPSRHYFYEMPDNLDIDGIIDGWELAEVG